MKNRNTRFDNVRIKSTGSCLPSKILSNEAATGKVGTSPEWIVETLGIHERRVAGPDEYSSDLGAQAGLNAVASAGIDKNEIDLIIVATSTPDRKAPSTACLVQKKMGIRNGCAAFDVAAVCSGFLYAVTIAGQFIQNGIYDHALVIGADTFSKITDWSHRNCVFFGDGAGAVVLGRGENGDGLFSSILHADGDGTDHFTVYPDDDFYTMNGRAVYETATTVLPECIRSILTLNGLKLSDVAMIIPHQPSMRVLRKTAELLEAPFSLIRTNMDLYANTAGATVPLLLDQVNRQGQITKGDLILFAAVGSGWTWGASLYRWQ